MKPKKTHSQSSVRRRFAAGLAGWLAAPVAALAQFSTPHLITTPGDVTNVLGATKFINHGLVGVGHISASALDSFGETFGSASSLQITGWTNNGDGTYSGTLNVLPDRGYNSGNFFSHYAARINQVGFKFTPYYGSTNIGGATDLDKLNAQTNQFTFGAIGGVKFTYFDPITGSNSFTTGLDPGTNSTTLFGKTMPYVGTYVGYQSPSSTSNTTYTGINKLPLDSEALVLKPDGSGYIGDEYGANVYYFNPSKQIIGAIVPPAAFQPHSPVGVLNYNSINPPLNGRRNNQGFEGVSLSPDGTRLFALLQTACVQDGTQSANNQNAKNTRLLIYDVSGNPTPDFPIAEYVLTLPTYKSSGNGSAPDKTCAQSEVVALDNHRFLVLPRDGNGLGNNANNPNVYKTIILVDTTVGSPVNLVADAARNAEGGTITSNGVAGTLDPSLTPLSWVEAVNMLNTNQLAKFNVTWDSGTNQVTKLTMGEKWEGAALVSANDPANPDDYFLFLGNDNDFLTSAGQIQGPDGTIVNYNGFAGYPANRIPAPLDSPNNENDTRILAFRVTIQKTLPQIDHIVLIYQENWSFDALYGNFPGANGIANASATSKNQLDRLTGNPISSLATYDPASSAIPTQNPPVPLNGVQDYRFLSDSNNVNSPSLVNTLLPYGLEGFIGFGPTSNTNNLTGDIVHRYWQEQFQIDHGNMDEFVTWSDNPGLVMSHFDATQLPEGVLAQQFTLCDNFYHSAFGGSFLNHQFLVAAQAPVYPNAAAIIPNNVALLDTNGVLQLNVPGNGRLTRDGNITPIGGVVFANTNLTFDKNYAVNTIYSVNLANTTPTATTLLPSQNDSNPSDLTRPYIPTIGDALDAAGVSWKWYSGGFDRALAISASNPTNSGVQKTDTSIKNFQWHHQAFAFYDNYAPWTNGVRNARSAAHLQDENNFYADVTNNTLPAVVFIKPLGDDNEHPGYASLLQGQQHVSNLVAAVQSNPALWAHTAIIITYDEHGGRWDHVTPPLRDIWGPGARVPGIIISPFAKTNYVDHTQYETLSFLKTVENRFGLAPLTSADASANSLASAFTAAASVTPAAPALAATATAGQVSLTWPAGFTGYVVQTATNLNNPNWSTVYSGTNSAFSVTPDASKPAAFYRLLKP